MQQGAAVIEFENAAGPGIFENCRIMNSLDCPVIRGLSPAGGVAQSNVMVDQCLIGGNSPAAVMEMQDRPQSRISNTCIAIPNAGPEDINGAQIGEGMSFGRCTSGSGLAAPDEVGSGGNISSLPAPNGSYNGSAASGAATQTPPRARARGAGSGSFFASLFGGFFGGIGLLLMMMVMVPVGFVALLWQLLSS